MAKCVENGCYVKMRWIGPSGGVKFSSFLVSGGETLISDFREKWRLSACCRC